MRHLQGETQWGPWILNSWQLLLQVLYHSWFNFLSSHTCFFIITCLLLSMWKDPLTSVALLFLYAFKIAKVLRHLMNLGPPFGPPNSSGTYLPWQAQSLLLESQVPTQTPPATSHGMSCFNIPSPTLGCLFSSKLSHSITRLEEEGRTGKGLYKGPPSEQTGMQLNMTLAFC